MPDVRGRTGSAIAADFGNPSGTPIVVDSAAGVAYVMLTNGAITSIGGGGGGGNVTFSAGTASAGLGSIVFSNSNGISFGLNGSTMTASAVGVGDGFNILAAGTQTATSAGTVKLADSNGISFGMSNSTQITASYTVPSTAGLISAIRLSAGTASNNLSAVTFSNSNNVSFGLNGSTVTATATFAQSTQPVAVSGSNGSFAFSTATFGNLNGLSFYTSNGSMVGSHNGLTTARASNDGVGLATAQTNVTWTVNSAGLSLNGSGYAGTGTSATNASVTLNSNGLAISVAAPGGGGAVTLSNWAWPLLQYNTQTQQALQSTFAMWPMLVEEVSAAYLRMASSVNVVSTSFASTANTTFSFNQAETHQWVLYSRGVGANSQSLQSLTSTSCGLTWSVNVAYGSASNTSHFNSYGLTYQMSTNTSSFSTGFTTSNVSTIPVSTGGLTALTGVKLADVPFATVLTNGQFWMAYKYSTTSTTQGTNLSGVRLQHSHLGMSLPNNAIGYFGQANAASVQWVNGVGSFTTVGGASTASLPISAISSRASHVMPFVTFERIA